jgi:adenine-specific DNA-methyltransferase
MFNAAFENVRELSERFESNFAHFTSSGYSEAEVRKDFIDKLFIVLGWDVNHDFQHNPFEQEVKVEKSQRQHNSVSQKRADYAFYLRPDYKNVKFFVEAKKPARNLYNSDDYFQTIRYAWNAGVGVSVLTDFEEFHIVDCRSKPDINYVFNGCHKKFTFIDYRDEEKFKEIYWTFSYEAVSSGNLEKYIDNLPKPKGTAKQIQLFGGRYQSIDESFLEYIDSIREKLAKIFYKNDNTLSSELLTEAVQKTIDRLVFIRFLEDKLIEPVNYVSEFGQRISAWKDFISSCRKLDVKYNGVVFKKHLIDEQNFNEEADDLFRQMCQDFSHLNTPYDFNAIPIHILGSIYERFLGKVVVVTDGVVRIEEKPTVRKAGGVYYTPKHVVDFIVDKTVGAQLKGKKPSEISKLRFADIACGSGSFLIGVLDLLLEYHIKYYNDNPKEAEKAKCHKVDGAFTLTIKQKQEILLSCIYGVDLDHQATEVTQLSLYLKMLEDETTATANEMQVLFHEKILPDLSRNILCGNSLIGIDILNSRLFELKEERQVNPFDYHNSFPQIFKQGGFDGIIGNPPYDVLEKERLVEFSPHEVLQEYVRNKPEYEAGLGGKLNLYRLFIVRSYQLLKEHGKLGLIVPMSIIGDKSCGITRKYIIKNSSGLSFDCFPQKDNANKRIFKDAKLSTCILICTKSAKKLNDNIIIDIKTYPYNSFDDPFKSCKIESQKLLRIDPSNLPIPLIDQSEWELLYKIHSMKNCTSFRMYSSIIIRRGEINQTIYKEFIESTEAGNEILIKGVQIGPFKFNKRLSQGKVEWFDEVNFLKTNSNRLLANERRIATQRITGVDEKLRLVATIIEPKAYFADSTNSISITDNCLYSLEYILGLINSKIYQWRFKLTSTNNNVGTNEIEALPFRLIDFDNPTDVDIHNKITSMVSQLLVTKSTIDELPNSSEKSYLERKVEGLTGNIDQAIFDLFNINEFELEVIAGSAQKQIGIIAA